MANIINAQDKFIKQYCTNTLNRLNKEISLLQKFISVEYPSWTLEFYVDFNKLRRSVTLKCRLISEGNVIPLKDTFLMSLSLPEKKFTDGQFMGDFLHVFNTEYRGEIARLIRNYNHLKMSEIA